PKPGGAERRGWEWHYLKRQCHTELQTIPTPPTQAMGVAFSPDDRHIATTGYDDKAVRTWNVETGDLEETLRGLPGPHGSLSEGLPDSRDGTLLAASNGTPSGTGGVLVWDAATGKQVWEFKVLCGESANVAFSPDGKRLAAVSGEPSGGGEDRIPKLVIW